MSRSWYLFTPNNDRRGRKEEGGRGGVNQKTITGGGRVDLGTWQGEE